MTSDAVETLWRRGHVEDIDRHFAETVAELAAGGAAEVALAAALTSVRARAGHSCLALADIAGRPWPDDAGAALPDFASWVRALAASGVVARAGAGERCPLVLDSAGRLYLERLKDLEENVADGLLRRAARREDPPAGLETALSRFFAADARAARPRAAARQAARGRLCAISGGPGTGKTTLAARIIAVLTGLGIVDMDRLALAAPTGKAATRLQEAVHGALRALAEDSGETPAVPEGAVTLHRWLHRQERTGAPVDALIVDEVSMVDVSLMARLLRVLPVDARLILLGDAFQLASVQPGSVFADMSDVARDPACPLHDCFARLEHNWRFDESSGISRLASAVAAGDAAGAVAVLDDPDVDDARLAPVDGKDAFGALAETFADRHFGPFVERMRALDQPGADDRPFGAFGVLCAHRRGPFGTRRFNRLVEQRLQARGLLDGDGAFYAGRPVIVTRNDPQTGLSNGDTGIVLRDASGRTRVWFPGLRGADDGPRFVAPVRLPPHESFFALSVHRSQGSEYDEVAFIPGPAGSRVATRELFYTAVTRSRRKVTVHGSNEAVVAAAEQVTQRSSGLRDILLAGMPTQAARQA